jgi:hypothetical protein
MRLLLTLAIQGGTARLPLSDSAAQRLVAALLSDSAAARNRHVADALACDPALAVWALCQAAADGHEDLRTIEQLAGWLAELPAAAWPAKGVGDTSGGSLADSEVELWADRCATAIGIATLAAHCAELAQLDAERARLLGLACAAPQWLAAAARDGAILEPPRIVPDWLAGGLLALELTATVNTPTSPAECVAAVCRAARGSTETCLGDFDATAHQAFVAEVREDWRRASDGGHHLVALLKKLARLEQLECDFQRTLEAEKLDSLKELAYGASHEINNPLANISARAQTLLVDVSAIPSDGGSWRRLTRKPFARTR